MAVSIPIVSEFDSKGIKSAINEFKSLEGAGAKASFAIKKAAIPATAAIAGIAAGLGMATQAAMEDAAAQDRLAGVLRRSAQATDEQIASTEEFISSLSRATAVADDELRPAMATLANAVGETTYAQELLVISQDVAAATGNDLATVTAAMAKAANGQTMALAKLDPALRGAVKEGMAFDDLLQMLQIHQGAAADASQTAAGKMTNLKIQMDEAKESIGAALLPAVVMLLDKLMPLATWVQENTKVVLIFIGAIGGLSAAVLAVNAAMKVYQATLVVVKVAQAALNFVMSANPIGLVIIAIAALVAAFVILEKKFGVVSKAAEFLGEAFTKYIINPLRVALDLAGKVASAIGKIANVAGAIGGGIGSFVGKIPGLADGGIVTGPTLAVVGEAGPEAVIPLSQMGGMGMGNVTVNVNATVADARLGDVIVNALRDYNRRSGPIQVSVA